MIFINMFKFLSVLIIMLFTFSLNLLALDIKNQTGFYNGSVYSAFLDAYNLMLMTDVKMSFNTAEEQIFYYIGTMFFLVIMMNLLISVITDVY